MNQVFEVAGDTPFRICFQCENEEKAINLVKKAKDLGMQVMITRSAFSDWDVVFTVLRAAESPYNP